MINFFRKIRKQLAEDNKPIKYMRYAVGEIVMASCISCGGIEVLIQITDNQRNMTLYVSSPQ